MPKTHKADAEQEDARELAMCTNCSGAGRIRDNTSSANTYTFNKKECPDCGGSGVNSKLTADETARLVELNILKPAR